MQVRKLVKSGESSLVTAIPQDWLKKNKLKAGDLVYFNDQNNSLVLQAEEKEEKAPSQEIVINIDGKEEKTIYRDINAAYLDNYDFVIIKGKEITKRSKKIKSFISDLVALEVMEESTDKIVAKNFLNIKDLDIKLLIRRMDNITRSMIIDLKQAITDKEIGESVVARDLDVNRVNFLVLKILKVANKNKSLFNYIGIAESDLLMYWDLNVHLEKIADRVKNMATLVQPLNKKEAEEFLEIFNKIDDMYKEGMTAFYENSTKKSDDVWAKRISIGNALQKYLKTNPTFYEAQLAINCFTMISYINDIGRIVRYHS
jgi:phosphate uptake regulator